jgi:hypothetical protein
VSCGGSRAGGRDADADDPRVNVAREGGQLRRRQVGARQPDAHVGGRRHQRGHQHAEAVLLAGQRAEDAHRPARPLIERAAKRPQQRADVLADEVLVTDVECLVGPPLTDRVEQRADTLRQEGQHAEPRPVGQQLLIQACGLVAPHGIEQIVDIRRVGHPGWRRCLGASGVREQRRQRAIGGVHHLAGAVTAGNGFADAPQACNDRTGIDAVAGRPPLGHGIAVALLPGAQRLDRDARGA